MVHREDRSERRGRREHVGQPGELLVAQFAVMPAGNRRVQGDEPQSVEFVHPVDRSHRVGDVLVEQARAEARAVVVVAHHPEHAGAEASGEGLDDRTQLGVGVALAEVDEIAGEHDAVGCDAGCLDRAERLAQLRGGIDEVEQPRSGRAQVGVAQVQQHALRRRIFGLTHALVPLVDVMLLAHATMTEPAKCYRHVS